MSDEQDQDGEIGIERFLRNIPGQITYARQQLFSTNINITEFIQRRLEDSLFMLNILFRRSLELGDG